MKKKIAYISAMMLYAVLGIPWFWDLEFSAIRGLMFTTLISDSEIFSFGTLYFLLVLLAVFTTLSHFVNNKFRYPVFAILSYILISDLILVLFGEILTALVAVCYIGLLVVLVNFSAKECEKSSKLGHIARVSVISLLSGTAIGILILILACIISEF